MKDLMIATLAVVLFISSWFLFLHYADGQSQAFRKQINEQVLEDIETGNWAHAEKQLKALSRDWHRFRKVSLFFLDTHAINDIDYSIARALMYTHARDDSNSTGELKAMVEQLSFLTDNESLSLQNIF